MMIDRDVAEGVWCRVRWDSSLYSPSGRRIPVLRGAHLELLCYRAASVVGWVLAFAVYARWGRFRCFVTIHHGV